MVEICHLKMSSTYCTCTDAYFLASVGVCLCFGPLMDWRPVKVKVKFICVAHFMYRTIQSALNEKKALQQGAEKALKYVKEFK